ncbi:hypothetical protein GIB67_013258, partial [Kingdonia uniflora]
VSLALLINKLISSLSIVERKSISDWTVRRGEENFEEVLEYEQLATAGLLIDPTWRLRVTTSDGSRSLPFRLHLPFSTSSKFLLLDISKVLLSRSNPTKLSNNSSGKLIFYNDTRILVHNNSTSISLYFNI